MIIHFLHGFLGFASDWDIFKNDFYPNKTIFYSIEDFLKKENKEKNDLKAFAENFNNYVFSQDKAKEKNILIGYSLGGRLALHCLAEENNHWDAAIIISANLGLVDEQEKILRIKNE